MSKQPALIGLSGGPGAGKDTAAGLLALHHGFIPTAFADSLRDFLYVTDPGWHMACDLYGYDAAKEVVAGFRDRMVEVGKAARDNINPRVWIDAAEAKIVGIHDGGHPAVVSDVRYHNEAAMIREHGGVIVGVDRPDHSPETQESSSVFLCADEYVMNHGSVLDLWAELEALIDFVTD